MARPGVNYDQVKQVCVKLLSQGTAPSVQKVREVLGTGSNTTLAQHLNRWRDDYANKEVHHLPKTMPKELIGAIEVLWQTAMEQAQAEFAQFKQDLETRYQKMVDNNTHLCQEITDLKTQCEVQSEQLLEKESNCAELATELVVANDRLQNQTEFAKQAEIGWQSRLQRSYEDREQAVEQVKALQEEVHQLNAKLEEQMRHAEAALYEERHRQHQSEDRWMLLIDQARRQTAEQQIALAKYREKKQDELSALKLQLQSIQQCSQQYQATIAVQTRQINKTQKALHRTKDQCQKLQEIEKQHVKEIERLKQHTQLQVLNKNRHRKDMRSGTIAK